MMPEARPGVPADDATSRTHRCFDPELAASPTVVLPIDAVIDLLQVTHAPDRIAAYREAMQRGERFPPVSVVRIAGRVLLADGHKRFSAYKLLPVTHIVVEIWPLRRWLRDQWRQFVHKTAQQGRLASRSFVDQRARAQARRLFWDTVGHWKRLALTLRTRMKHRDGKPTDRARRRR